jgi:hypothetical protein
MNGTIFDEVPIKDKTGRPWTKWVLNWRRISSIN